MWKRRIINLVFSLNTNTNTWQWPVLPFRINGFWVLASGHSSPAPRRPPQAAICQAWSCDSTARRRILFAAFFEKWRRLCSCVDAFERLVEQTEYFSLFFFFSGNTRCCWSIKVFSSWSLLADYWAAALTIATWLKFLRQSGVAARGLVWSVQGFSFFPASFSFICRCHSSVLLTPAGNIVAVLRWLIGFFYLLNKLKRYS